MSNMAELLRLAKKGRRTEARGKAVERFISRFLVLLLTGLIDGWFLMIAVGILHIHWWPGLPTIGYSWAVLAVIFLRGVFSPLPSKESRS